MILRTVLGASLLPPGPPPCVGSPPLQQVVRPGRLPGSVRLRRLRGGAFDDPDMRLSGFEGAYVLVPRGRCSFESKARSAHRLGALGVVVRNTLDWRYVPPLSANGGMGGDVEATWPAAVRDYECGDRPAAGRFGFRAEVDPAALDLNPPPVRGRQARRRQ